MAKLTSSPESGIRAGSSYETFRSEQIKPIHRHKTKRWITRGLGLLAFSVIGGLTGASLDETPVTVGPHSATAKLSFDGYATADLGPLGAIRIPTNKQSGLQLGTQVHVKEIPTNTGEQTVLPAFEDLSSEISPAELERYSTLYANIEDDSSSIQKALMQQMLKYSLLTAGATIGAYKLVGSKRWEELKNQKKFALCATAGMILLSGDVYTLQPDRGVVKDG